MEDFDELNRGMEAVSEALAAEFEALDTILAAKKRFAETRKRTNQLADKLRCYPLYLKILCEIAAARADMSLYQQGA